MKKILFYLLLVVLLMQVIRPTKNYSDELSENAIQNQLAVPKNIQEIIDRSCNDCHSNNTNYEWYHEIAPISWVVANPVKEGKEHMNFDEWGAYNEEQMEHIIDDLQEAIETREMPIVGYLKLHPEAIISDADNQFFLKWIATLDLE